ncbi:(2Fe-2S)-binding protein [Sphingobium chungangianum]
MDHKITVNGRSVSVEADEETPLLWSLREQLALRGTKFGCGLGQCGACTVLVDGSPSRSCVTPTSSVADASIMTIEGAAADAVGRRVQSAWEKLAVVQCGYCQSGQIMAAIALLKSTPRPTDADIDAAMTNLCRCGTYPRIRAAIHLAAKTDDHG